jgi:hypothetical protein
MMEITDDGGDFTQVFQCSDGDDGGDGGAFACMFFNRVTEMTEMMEVILNGVDTYTNELR